MSVVERMKVFARASLILEGLYTGKGEHRSIMHTDFLRALGCSMEIFKRIIEALKALDWIEIVEGKNSETGYPATFIRPKDTFPLSGMDLTDRELILIAEKMLDVNLRELIGREPTEMREKTGVEKELEEGITMITIDPKTGQKRIWKLIKEEKMTGPIL